MALKLTLKPGEKFVINGAVIANGDRRATLVLHNKASILREKDILKPERVDTPAKRIYFAIMSMYLDEKVRPRFYEEFVLRMSEFMGVVTDADALANCVAISQCVMDRQYYKGLTLCRRLLDFERERLSYEPASV
ncbi:flagellar biosynthesis repressor FlbT [Minwuia thermotolerans]|jgi:flagellar protein FlbT|uniref:Flagellar biosynthesis repressor FlbT n=1 Tax=Minwuia thermotolerans TaxID=2056226 RepID=A0A2M9G197_9PROT|nr:flagellar biosynthesis repressor FlbT [Minwuia thermotolerans]ANK81337.1 MAG: flagellar biosynthesis repressor FlbT [Rhizobiales bacterium NRL2]PJK29497.1 flagellar biosynthesis repressor FlbT [Minwuia thermotolerans]